MIRTSPASRPLGSRRLDGLALGLVELLDEHRGRVRNLLAAVAQHLLADVLGHEGALGLVGEHVRVEESLALRQVREHRLEQVVHAVALAARTPAPPPRRGTPCGRGR